MKIRAPKLAPALRGARPSLPLNGSLATALSSSTRRSASSLSQRPDSRYVQFPGAVKSAFTTKLQFEQPSSHDAMPTYRAVDQSGNVVDPSFKPDLGDEEVIKLYKHMLLVSIMDIIMFDSQRQGRISFYMVSAGEEAVCVGSASALTKEDVIFCQYREQGVFAQRGFTPKDFMNQLFANKMDPGKGRNMPVHYGSKELNIHTISSPLGTQIPHASGAAYALKMQRLQNPSIPPRVVAVYFGEGAASEGDFHAALNIAATRSCPVVFICRNNGYSISTPVLEQYRGDGIASRGVGYGIETIRVDGNDIWAIREATKRAREMALQDGGKPVLIEALTYRVGHHSTSDDSFAYRARVEVEDWKRRDNPISRLRKWMEAKGIWDEHKEKEARDSTRRDLLKAFQEAEKEKKPPIRAMFEDVYEELTPDLKKQMSELKEHLDKYPDEYDVGEFEGVEGSDKTAYEKHLAPSEVQLATQHIEADHPVQPLSTLPNMPDDNLAIILTLFLLFLVIGIGAYFGRKWIRDFTTAMVHAKQAERGNAKHLGSVPIRRGASKQRQAMTCMSSPTAGKAELGKRSERATSWAQPLSTPKIFLSLGHRLTFSLGTNLTDLPALSFFSEGSQFPLKMAAPRPVLGLGANTVRSCLRNLRSGPAIISTTSSRPFSATTSARDAAPTDTSNRPTHFGYETVTEAEKRKRVADVFSSVAETYDRMNDLMSFGWHRVWKDHYVSSLNPGFSSDPSHPPAQHILDIAGGTGDIAFRHLNHAHVVNRNPNVRVTISDINPDMLAVGKQRSQALPAGQQAALSFLEANAEDLRTAGVPDASVDLYTVAFGIRNFSNIPAALREAHRVLKPGGVLAVLEFSKADRWTPLFAAAYRRWSFGAIPLIGQLVAGDRDSYQYLVESIERFPSQDEFRDLILDAGFVVGGEGYENLTGGVAAIHRGMKPKE